MLGPYPVTPEAPTSLSWKQGWVRLPIDSCWWGGGVGKMKKTPHWKL